MQIPGAAGDLISPETKQLIERIADYYLADPRTVHDAFLPPEMKRPPKIVPAEKKAPAPPQPMNAAQADAVRAIADTPTAAYAEHLVWGVTGSGKTRIYEHLIAQALGRGEQVLFLVPEIALSSQLMDVIRASFPDNTVLYHSGLSDGERYRSYQRFLTGDASIAVGTRSAVFMPARRLALIIIDEEHDASYKDQWRFRFDARTIARLRQEQQPEVKLVLGSATPSMESLARAKSGAAKLYRLRQRATGQSLPSVFIPEYKTSHGIISPFLMQKMQEHLAQGNQVLLMMNRRGHSTHVHCDACDARSDIGYAECPRCSVALTYHKDNRLRCHQCGYDEAYSVKCPKDGAERRLTGRGIQRVEEILETQFADFSYARLDRDTAARKGFVSDVLASMRERKIDILIGTQMIAKGFDLEGVTLVGVLAIDGMLTAPDFRASESAWQLLAQVIGRAGRHRPGEVVIQTMAPHHPVIQAAEHHNADEFYAAEAAQRRITKYPPFGALARLVIFGENESALVLVAEKISRDIQPMSMSDLFGDKTAEAVELLGPATPGLSKAEGEYRVHFLVKAAAREPLHSYLRRVKPILEKILRASEKTHYVLDLEPRDMG